jgi:hypothetical protein
MQLNDFRPEADGNCLPQSSIVSRLKDVHKKSGEQLRDRGDRKEQTSGCSDLILRFSPSRRPFSEHYRLLLL